MMFLSILLMKFIAMLVLVPVYLLARRIHRRMKPSRFKRILFMTLPGHRPRDWR
jgi:hypothetical protein